MKITMKYQPATEKLVTVAASAQRKPSNNRRLV